MGLWLIPLVIGVLIAAAVFVAAFRLSQKAKCGPDTSQSQHAPSLIETFVDVSKSQQPEPDTSQAQNIVPGNSSVQDAWYYAHKNGRVGPLSLQGLREALATLPTAYARDVLVWHPRLPDWKPARDVSELNEGETALPPPLPTMAKGATDLEGWDRADLAHLMRHDGPQGIATARYNVTLAGLSPLLILSLIAFGGWAYFGFPSPSTLLNWSSAEQECVKFAEENRDKGKLFDIGNIIKATGSWIKNGKIVVEIGAYKKASDTSFSPRICVVGGGYIEIVSILESAVWR